MGVPSPSALGTDPTQPSALGNYGMLTQHAPRRFACRHAMGVAPGRRHRRARPGRARLPVPAYCKGVAMAQELQPIAPQLVPLPTTTDLDAIEVIKARAPEGLGFHFKVRATGAMFRFEPTRHPRQPRFWC